MAAPMAPAWEVEDFFFPEMKLLTREDNLYLNLTILWVFELLCPLAIVLRCLIRPDAILTSDSSGTPGTKPNVHTK